MEESSAGACLEGREKSRLSFLPAFRSSASELIWGSFMFIGRFDLWRLSSVFSWPRFRLPSVSCAFANAPKEIEAASSPTRSFEVSDWS